MPCTINSLKCPNPIKSSTKEPKWRNPSSLSLSLKDLMKSGTSNVSGQFLSCSRHKMKSMQLNLPILVPLVLEAQFWVPTEVSKSSIRSDAESALLTEFPPLTQDTRPEESGIVDTAENVAWKDTESSPTWRPTSWIDPCKTKSQSSYKALHIKLLQSLLLSGVMWTRVKIEKTNEYYRSFLIH